jgi:hypothetical protein
MAASKPQDTIPRRATRVPFFEPVQIRKPVPILTQGVDVGAKGVGLRSTVAIPVDTAVELELFGGRAIFLGTVRWCSPLGSGFRIGVEFTEEDASLIEQIHAMRSRAKAGPR